MCITHALYMLYVQVGITFQLLNIGDHTLIQNCLINTGRPECINFKFKVDQHALCVLHM